MKLTPIIKSCAYAEYKCGKKIILSVSSTNIEIKGRIYIEFSSDPQIFSKYSFDMDIVEKQVWNYAFLHSRLFICCNNKEFFSKNGLADLLFNEIKNKDILYDFLSYKDENLEFVFTHTSNMDKTVCSFVNGQNTKAGDTHVNFFLEGFSKGISSFFKQNYEQKDITSGLTAVLKIGLNNPVFASQTKDKLGNFEIRMPIINKTQTAVGDWLRRNSSSAFAIK